MLSHLRVHVYVHGVTVKACHISTKSHQQRILTVGMLHLQQPSSCPLCRTLTKQVPSTAWLFPGDWGVRRVGQAEVLCFLCLVDFCTPHVLAHICYHSMKGEWNDGCFFQLCNSNDKADRFMYLPRMAGTSLPQSGAWKMTGIWGAERSAPVVWPGLASSAWISEVLSVLSLGLGRRKPQKDGV